jgi:hypothetical protein
MTYEQAKQLTRNLDGDEFDPRSETANNCPRVKAKRIELADACRLRLRSLPVTQ